MSRPPFHRVALLASAGLLLCVGGCNAPPMAAAREQAEGRWSQARADVKARLASAELAAGNLDAAAAELGEARRLAPATPAYEVLEARLLLARGQFGEAEKLLAGLAERAAPGPARGEVLYLQGVVHQQRLAWEPALVAYLAALQENPADSACLAAAVQAHLQLGRPEAGLALLEQQREQLGWTSAYQAAAAECHEQLGNWVLAAAAWRRVAHGKEDPSVSERLGLALFRAGQYAEAAPLLRAALDGRGPASEAAGDADLRLALAECLLELRDARGAGDLVAPVLRESPRNIRALQLRARGLAVEGEFARALRLVEQALEASPAECGVLGELAATLAYRAGDCARAVHWARACASASPESAVIAEQVLARCGEAASAPRSGPALDVKSHDSALP